MSVKSHSLADDDVVDTFPKFCRDCSISLATGNRLLASRDGPPVVWLSERRKGVRRKDRRAWLEARTENPQRVA